jgi:hypothetical protein
MANKTFFNSRRAAALHTGGFAVRAVRPAIVPHGSARLRFSLTSGISNDELVRLENSLSFLYTMVPFFSSSGAQTLPSKEGGYKRVEEKKSGSRARVRRQAATIQSWREQACWSAAVARA